MTRSPAILLVGSWAVVVLTVGVGARLGSSLPPLRAAILLLGVYWISCWVVILLDAPATSRLALLRPATRGRPGTAVLAWLPAVAVGVAVFLPAVSSLVPMVVAGAAAAALVNAVTEEMLWRGAFVMRFPERIHLGFLFPLVPFAAWHLALAQVPIDYGPGGAVALVGGAAGLGLIWGWVVWRTRNLRAVTMAHAVTNFLGFSAVGASNWPSP